MLPPVLQQPAVSVVLLQLLLPCLAYQQRGAPVVDVVDGGVALLQQLHHARNHGLQFRHLAGGCVRVSKM